jgi:acyl carrier protein
LQATTAEESDVAVDEDQILAEIDEMIRTTMNDFDEDLEITMNTAFADLEMDSLNIVTLAGRVQARYGWGVNFAQFLADIGTADVTELRIGRVVGYIADSLNGQAEVAAQ